MIHGKEKYFQGRRKRQDITCEAQVLKCADEIHTAVFFVLYCAIT